MKTTPPITLDTKQEGNSGGTATPPDPHQWIEECGDYLFRYAMMRVSNRETAEDLVQDTLIAAIKGYENFEGRSTIKTWLVGILKNKIIDHIRKVSRRGKLEVLPTEEEPFERNFNRLGIWNTVLADWAGDPDELLHEKQLKEVLKICLAKVPLKSRQAFVLKTFDNKESDEICNILDITPSNLWVLLHRCRNSLRECLEINWVSKR